MKAIFEIKVVEVSSLQQKSKINYPFQVEIDSKQIK